MSYFLIIRGPLGIGKTTIAKKLSEKLNGTYISIDDVLHENFLESEWEEGYISQKSFIKANEIAFPEAKKSLEANKPVIFDGNFYWKSQVDDLEERLKDFQGFVFKLKAPMQVCLDRDSKREKSYGRGAVEVVYQKATSCPCGLIIDATKPEEEIVEEIISHLPS